jgi:hypothetical protein
MQTEIFNSDRSQDAPTDNFETFFLRSKAENGVVLTQDPVTNLAIQAPMAALSTGPQLLRVVPISVPLEIPYVQLVNQSSGMALAVNDQGVLFFTTSNQLDSRQQWKFGAVGELVGCGAEGNVVTLFENGYRFAESNPADPRQLFEVFYPSNFVYIRNSWTGKVLTADESSGVSWQPMNPTNSAFQQWGVTYDGFIVNQASAEVLEPLSKVPAPGMTLTTGKQVALGSGDAYQRFDVNQPDGTFHNCADRNLVIGRDISDHAVMAPYTESDFTQLVEFISPFQFFALTSACNVDENPVWLERKGTSLVTKPSPGWTLSELFTVSRYGEIISPLDGFVLASGGVDMAPLFVDPAPEAIGYDTTTFVYSTVSPEVLGLGTIALRKNPIGYPQAGLVITEGNAPRPFILPLHSPHVVTQLWSIVGAPNSLVSSNQTLVRSFFSDPAPLPGEPSLQAPASAEIEALVGDLPKTTRVIIALISGCLELAGFDVGEHAWKKIGEIAKIVLGSSEVAARVAVVMQGAVTIASIIAVADGISKAGLWWKILKLVLPNSFWGWALYAAKLAVFIASLLTPYGYALRGAKLAVLVMDILLILGEDEQAVAREVALLNTYVASGSATTVDVASVAQ